MENFFVKDIVAAINGQLLYGDENMPVSNFCTDSNKVGENNMFVPVIGERVDGHRFIKGALDNGAVGSLTSSKEAVAELISTWQSEGSLGKPIILVDNTVAALQRCAKSYEQRISIPKLGVTGSVGKTTTKEMIACALSGGLKVFKTAGNSNSQIGVPITIMNIKAEDEIAVIEMGMSEKGEMERLAKLLNLDAVVLTNIGVSHIEQLGSQENILKEKWHIADALKSGGAVFLNGDDELLRKKAQELEGDNRYKVITFGKSEGCTYRAVNVAVNELGINFDAEYGKAGLDNCCGNENKSSVNIQLSVLGDHNVINALVALAVAKEFGVAESDAVKALSEYRGIAMRQQVTKKDGIIYIDDSYNASPDSMKAGLSVLAQTKAKRRIAVLADMLELGENAAEYHRQVGEYAGSSMVDELVLFGELAKNIGYGAEQYVKNITAFSTREELVDYLCNTLIEGDAVLFKGSRGMKLNEVVDALISGGK